MDAEEEAPALPRKGKRLLLTILLAASAVSLAALGIWQIARRTEKVELIAAVEQRVNAAPGAAPGPADWAHITDKGDAYRHVRVRGTFLHDRETLVQAATRLGAGYWVVTPLRTDAGWTVLVNRGYVPPEHRGRATRRAGEPQGPVTVTGLLRSTEPGGGFLRSNDPAQDRWYSRDVAAIGRARHLVGLAPYFIDADAEPGREGQPLGGMTILSFPNNHLQYALTWFALAAFGTIRVRRGGRAGR